MLKSKRQSQWKRLSPRGKSNRSKERQSWQSAMMAKHGKGEFCEWYEGCSDRGGIANAHRLKKVLITTALEWIDGRAHLCQSHHRALDEATGEDVHERMWVAVNKCMENAGRFVPRQD